MKKSLDQNNVFHEYSSIFLLVLVAVVFSYLFWDLMLPRMDFYNELWGPSLMLVRGRSPYDTSSLNPNLPAAWFPMAIGFFFPLGWLSENIALQVWYVFNIVELCLIIYLVQGRNRSLYNTLALALIGFFFPLTFNHINLGQFTITVTLSWILSIYFHEKERSWMSALCAALALSKPHLGILVLLNLSYREYLKAGFSKMISLWLRISVMCLILCVPLFVAYPNWIPEAIVSMGKNPPWTYPSLFTLFERFFDGWGHVLWGVTTAMVIGMNFWLVKKFPLKQSVYWSLALAPLITPYVGSWDFVILFPLMIWSYANVNWIRKIFFWVAYCAAWYGMARVQMLQVSHNHYFWWVPLWFIGTAVIITDWKGKIEE